MGGWVGRVCEEEARLAARELHAMDVTEGETWVGVTGGGSVQGGSRGRVGGSLGVGGSRVPSRQDGRLMKGRRDGARGGEVWVGGSRRGRAERGANEFHPVNTPE